MLARTFIGVVIRCGAGYGKHYLYEEGANYVVGVDVSADAKRFAKTHYPSRNIDFCLADATSFRFRRETFDVAVCFEVFEYLPKYLRFLEEIVRVLSRRGVCLISVPNKLHSSPSRNRPLRKWRVKEFYPELP